MWTIQKVVSKGDYNYAVVPEHPFATKSGYVLEHRIVMENTIGRLLTDQEIVHHKDGDTKNNDPTNLEVQSIRDHSRYHGLLRGKKTVLLRCPWCGEQFVRDRRQTFLCKGGKHTCCSRVCSGKLKRKLQLYGMTSEIRKAIDNNVIKVYRAGSSIG